MYSQESERIALFDMDGTLFNLDSRMKEELEKMRSPNEPEIVNPFEDLPWLENRRRAIKRVSGFWRSLPKWEPGWEILEIAKEIGFDIHILTKGPSSKGMGISWMEKMECIRDHFGTDVTLHISEDKSVTYGRVLVDDFENYVKGWLHRRCRGLAIMPAHDYNEHVEHPNIIRYDGSNLNEIRLALQAAYDRGPKEHWRDRMEVQK